MSSIIQTIKDKLTSNTIYPITLTKAVYDDDSNKLSDILDGKVDTSTLTNYSTTSQMNTAIGAHHDSSKQDTLVSGTSIKTVNDTSLLGSGNIAIPKGDKGDTGDSGVYVGTDAPTGSQNVWIETDATPDTLVTGVKVAGTELVKDAYGKVDVPAAGTSSSQKGVVWGDYNSGLAISASGYIYVDQATNNQLGLKTAYTRAVTPSNLDYAIKRGLGHYGDVVADTWTDTEKKTACSTIGARYDGPYELIEEITLTEDTQRLFRTHDLNGNPYNFKKLSVSISVPAQETLPTNRNLDSKTNNRSTGYFGGIISTTNLMASEECEICNGYISSKYLTIAGGVDYASAMQARLPFVRIAASAITSYDIGGQVLTTTMPAGTNIKIYGVWA